MSALILLPPKISASDHVKQFFSITDEDIVPPTAEELAVRPPNIITRLMKGVFELCMLLYNTCGL